MLVKRSFSRSVCLQKRMQGFKPIPVTKQAQCFERVLQKAEKKRLRQAICVPSVTTWNEYARNTLKSVGSHRMAVLNSVFFQHITDLSYSGDYGPILEENGIDIVEVKVTENYHLIYVYWIHSRDVDEEEVNNILNSLAGTLRFQLSSLKFMGKVPEIRFVKNMYAQQSKEVDKVLEILDSLKETDVDVTLETDDLDEIEERDEWKITLTPDLVSSEVEPIPQMKHDVYDLNHERISSFIMKAKQSPVEMLWKTERVRGMAKDTGEGEQNFDKKKLKRIIHHKCLLKECIATGKELTDQEEYDDDDDEDDEEEMEYDLDETEIEDYTFSEDEIKDVSEDKDRRDSRT